MTMAVCYKCGEIKFGAFCPCPKCHRCPTSEDDLALSLAMTDHYFDLPSLEQMGKDLQNGKPLHLDDETRAQLIEVIHSSGMLQKLQSITQDADSIPVNGEKPQK